MATSSAHDDWVLPVALERQAAARPEQVFVTVLDEGRLTYDEAARDARRVAAHLASLGVGPGDPVVTLLPNGLDFVRLWLGLGRLGAVIVPLNTGLTGEFLAHQLRDSGAHRAITTPERVGLLRDLAPAGMTVTAVPDWRSAAEYSGDLPGGRDLACLMYTSGTTGPSKGVLMPHAHCYLFGVGSIAALGITERDRYYVTMPLFHANGLFMQLAATLVAGASAVLRERFSASNWLDDIRAHRITVTNLLGSMSQFVIAQPETSRDRDHGLRVVCPVPNPPAHERAWRERFGIPEVVSGYGMTEVNIPLYGRLGSSRPGRAGVVLDEWFEVEIRDPDTDEPLPPGAPGEIMVRPKVPWGFMAGYHGLPAKTVEAWRNFWFHTGDLGVADDEGWITFLDRTKDSIRRRGENISSLEVENAVVGVPGIAQVAAYAVPADQEGTEDEVMLALVLEPGHADTPDELVGRIDAVLPRFARPRYLEIVPELPRTPTEKVRKQELRTRGVTAATWDRQAGPATGETRRDRPAR